MMVSMSIIEVSLEGYGRAHLCLDLIDPAGPDDTIEVWRGVFSEVNDFDGEDLITVFFEMDFEDSYELWDLVSIALEAYKLEVDSIV